jgi:hypothetical protein
MQHPAFSLQSSLLIWIFVPEQLLSKADFKIDLIMRQQQPEKGSTL